MSVLEGERVRLRQAEPGDVTQRLALGNAPEIQRMFGADPASVRELTPDAAAAWVSALEETEHGWVITAEGRLIGSVRLHSLNPMDHRGSVAIGILDPAALGKGYGTEALRLVAGYAFDTLKLNRLGIRVLADNDRAIAAYAKVGFIVEGRERETALIDGVWYDDLIMGLLAREYAQGAAG